MKYLQYPTVFMLTQLTFFKFSIKEELFWRNYFYRVSLLRQSTELSSMTQGEGNRDSANHSRESSFDEEDKTGIDPFFKVAQVIRILP